ncbi:UDP-glucose 4-epimerase GalE [Aurantimonas sp. MSK8Z-1]|uniref:UDP-glucose 4-epimerase GalE n=1 Tax=Mangrovibrevibacter kandeliae TaxID=2968473 RepID=UPI002118B145|nr:UDP-glucose 4-epimerase GalE [Aurantimonas sp. MSK8Z-1]MCW4116971.1 UDP-glucose 4-epimerase GalE [Aurantimonas sp. MSK8Z-1]
MQTVLVVGGAGYIGSHTCMMLADRGYRPVVYDDLSSGHADFVQWGALEVGDVGDRRRLEAVIRHHAPVAVFHLAALTGVGESMLDPLSTYRANVANAIELLAAMRATGIDKLVFASSCAVFGPADRLPLVEDHPRRPISPYGRSKAMIEEVLEDLGRSGALRSVSLRFFNAAGADLKCRIGERHRPETHLIPVAIEAALGDRANFQVFGEDYETRDGTCLRDYVHVLDLADAFVRALEHLMTGGVTLAVNLGREEGTTVREVLASIERVSGRTVPVTRAPRRPGDPAALTACAARARAVLGWTPRYDLDAIVRSAFDWHLRERKRRDAAG